MDKTQEILFHIEELYSEKPSQYKVEQMCKANPTRYQAWVDAFKDYDLPDVLAAIDNFWEFKSSKTKPNVAQVKAILTTHKAEKLKQAEALEPKREIPTPENLMSADRERGDLKYFLWDYKDAYKLVVEDWLQNVIPAGVFAVAKWPQNAKLALENGLFNRFGEALKLVAQKRYGREFAFYSDNQLKAQNKNKTDSSLLPRTTDVAKSLASHWRME